MHKGLVLFIHGLGGRPNNTWGRFEELLNGDDELNSHRVGHFSYPTFLFRLPFGQQFPRIQTLATALETQIDLRYSDFPEITLVCHSLGGLIGKQYLINQIENHRQTPVKRMLLFAVPSNGAALASVANYISWRHAQLAQLCRDSDLVRHIAEAWSRCKACEHVSVRYVVAALDRVVDEMSARESWANDKIYVIADRGHRDVVKPNGIDDLPYIVLKRFLTEPANIGSSAGKDRVASAEQEHKPLILSASGPLGNPNQEMRVACAGLLRIEHRGNYLLVRNFHRKEQFGPLGGVYKFFSEGRRALDRLDFRPQALDADMVHDLRGFLPSKSLSIFIEWFKGGHGRETYVDCLRRELCEECNEADIVAPPGVDQIRFDHVRTVEEGPAPVPAEDYIQYRTFDVYELLEDTLQGQTAIEFLRDRSEGNPNLLWATSEEIVRGRTQSGSFIGSHAAYLVGSRRYWDEGPSFPH